MKALDMKPTSDNLFDALKEDTVGRNADVFRFASILNEIDGRCSIAVDGNWGSGKTFFVKQVKMVRMPSIRQGMAHAFAYAVYKQTTHQAQAKECDHWVADAGIP